MFFIQALIIIQPLISFRFFQGTVLGKIEFLDDPIDFADPNLRNLMAEVSTNKRMVYGEGNPYKIAMVDCGVKHNMIRNLIRVYNNN